MQNSEIPIERDNLIIEHQRYVHSVVSKMIRSMNLPNALRDEFISAGYLGLVEAAERYDSNSKAEFKNFAYLRIRGSVIDCVRRMSHISGQAYKYSKAMQAANELREEVLQFSNDSAVSESKITATRHKLAHILDFVAKGILAFKLSMCEVESEVENVLDEQLNPEEEYVARENFKEISDLVETLPEKERLIIREHYFNGKSFQEIVDENEGMSKSWVSRLHTRAIEKIKNNMVNEELSKTESNCKINKTANCFALFGQLSRDDNT